MIIIKSFGAIVMFAKWEKIKIKEEKRMIETQETADSLILDQFLSANNLKDIYYFAQQVQPKYIIANNVLEELSILELVADMGKVDHDRVILDMKSDIASSHACSSVAMVESFLFELNEVGAFFRALENGHINVAKKLLLYLADHFDFDDVSTNEKIIKKSPYLSKMTRSSNYNVLSFNQVKITGNLLLNTALFLAAGLKYADIFNILIKNKPLNDRSTGLCIAAFLAATRNEDGAPKAMVDINRTIVFQLLDIEAVYRFSSSRLYDFGSLISEFDTRNSLTNKRGDFGLFKSSSSVNELSDIEAATTDVSSSRAPSSMLDEDSHSYGPSPFGI